MRSRHFRFGRRLRRNRLRGYSTAQSKGVKKIYGTYHTVPPNPPSGFKPIALPDANTISTALESFGDFEKIDVLYESSTQGTKPRSKTLSRLYEARIVSSSR